MRAAGLRLADKALFGSDFPAITPDRWMTDFAGLGVKSELPSGSFKLNAASILGLV